MVKKDRTGEVKLPPSKKREILNQTKRVKVEEVGSSGTKLFGGRIYEEYNPKLAGERGLAVYDEMRRSDAQVFATLLACELPIRSTLWSIIPGFTKKQGGEEEITDQDYEIAAFVEDAFFNKMEHTFDDYLRQALTMLPNGFSLFEKVWYEMDGKIYIKKMAMRLARTVYKWVKDKETGKVGIQQFITMSDDNKPANIDIPGEKLVRFTFRQEGDNYEGTSVLRSAYKHWYIKDTLYKLDVVKHEKQAVGIPVLSLPEVHDTDDVTEAENILENLRANEKTFVILPGPDWKFEFANMSGSVIDPEKTIQHHNREISKNILAQFMELGASGGSGSYALSENQQDFFMLSLTAIAKQFAGTNNREVIKELVDMNFDISPDQTYPALTFNKLGEVDITSVSTALSSLASGGLIVPDEDLEDHVRKMFDLPKKMEAEDTEEVDDPNAEPDDEGEGMEEMATQSETPATDAEAEAMDSNAALADLEKELAALEASEMDIFRIRMATQFTFNEFGAALFRAPISQEARDKISAGLKAYWDKHGRKTPEDLKKQKDSADTRISNAKSEIADNMNYFQKQISPLKDQIASLTKLKESAGKGDKKKLTAGIKAVREQIKALRSQQSEQTAILKTVKAEALQTKKAAMAEIKQRKQAIESAIKQMREKVKAENATRSESIRALAAQIRANAETMRSIREQATREAENAKGQQKKDIRANARAILDGIRGENKTIRSAAQTLRDEAQAARDEVTQKADYIREAADMKKKPDPTKKTDLAFSDPEDEQLFSEMKGIFDPKVILQVQNHG